MLNCIAPLIYLYLYYNDPNFDFRESLSIFSLLMMGGMLNMYICSQLGEEINKQGLPALIWGAFFNYLAFLVLMTLYIYAVVSKANVEEIDEKKRMREILVAGTKTWRNETG